MVGIGYVKCNNTGEILKPPQNIITVQGESVQFNCSVQGDVADTAPDKDLESYWGVIFQLPNNTKICTFIIMILIINSL